LKAYVLIQAEPHARPLARTLRAIPGIVSATDLSGAYDAIALARFDSTSNPMDGVLTQIRSLPGVTHALPAPVVASPAPGAMPTPREQRAVGDAAA